MRKEHNLFALHTSSDSSVFGREFQKQKRDSHEADAERYALCSLKEKRRSHAQK